MQTELAYIAGLFDGEGALMLKLHKRTKARATSYYAFRVVIKMNEGLWERIVEKLAIGHFYRKRGRHGEQTRWEISKKHDIFDFLNAILPFALIKKERIQQALDLLKQNIEYCKLPETESIRFQMLLQKHAKDFSCFHKRKKWRNPQRTL